MVFIDCQRYIYFVVFSSWMSTLFHMMNKLYRIITGANWFWLTLVRELHLNIICSSLHDDSKGNRSIICSERICLLLLSLFIEFSDMNFGPKWGTYLGAFYFGVELYTYLVKPYKGTWVSCIFFLRVIFLRTSLSIYYRDTVSHTLNAKWKRIVQFGV